MNRRELSTLILARLNEEHNRLSEEFRVPGRIQTCTLERLLPEDVAEQIYRAFPKPEEMMVRKTIREHKHVAAQMNKYNPLLEEAVFAFQDPRIVGAVHEITGIQGLLPDNQLYAGGISLMAKGNFLNPHLDNSHDKERQNYRVLNLLYYVTPHWQQSFGGNLELWDEGPKGKPREIHSGFNRLVMMATHEKSWHSVNQVKVDGSRCCVSNYYFSPKPLESHEYFHVTSFRGRPEQMIRDVVLQADGAARMGIRKLFKKGAKETEHTYKR